ncbi:MAG: caspase family protein, partial [candidate division KSB1 bacterium]|nr:caspase family protein [candidate division KSB1 bacterium]
MKNKTRWLLLLALLLSIIAYILQSAYSQSDIQNERLSDGVERWYRTSSSADRPWFFQQLQNIFSVIQPSKELPFGRSVALLVGVSEYHYLTPSLPFVKNDIRDMREFLLTKGGFDEVYIATEKIVNRDLIEHYIVNVFFKKLSNRDRFLFYYAGHGDDAGGNTGYMQFYGARPKNFVGSQVLKIKDAETWCSETSIKHLLFIFDCCASGLAFTPRGGDDNVQQLLSTLSGNGSRAIITAGTADEQTFEVPRPGGKGNGVLTRALLDALERGLADKGKDGFITVDEIYAHVKDQVASFSARYQKRLTPRLWTLDPADYRGTFVFINPEAQKQGIMLAADYSSRLGAVPVPRGETIATYGIIQLTAYISGEVFIDGVFVEKIESGDSKQYRDIRTGTHKVEIRTGTQIYAQNVTVMKGQVNNVTIQPQRVERTQQDQTAVTPPTEKIVNGMTLVFIPGGTFDMGDTFGDGDDDEKPVHSVTVSDFYMSQTEVTNAQYANFLN